VAATVLTWVEARPLMAVRGRTSLHHGKAG
jgi:hypothetical protein